MNYIIKYKYIETNEKNFNYSGGQNSNISVSILPV